MHDNVGVQDLNRDSQLTTTHPCKHLIQDHRSTTLEPSSETHPWSLIMVDSILSAISCGQTEVAQEKKELRTTRCSTTPQGWLLWTYLKLAYGHHHLNSSQTRRTSPCCGSSLSRQAVSKICQPPHPLDPAGRATTLIFSIPGGCLGSTQSGQSQDNCLSEPPHKGGRTDLQPSVWTWNRTCYWLPPHLCHHLTPTPHLQPACLRAPLILKLNHIHLNLHLLPTHCSSIPYHPI